MDMNMDPGKRGFSIRKGCLELLENIFPVTEKSVSENKANKTKATVAQR